ncbi:ankyrin repeat-containing protein ITN1-like isoform X3 [Corylus avellana]|uniref:ankyrin repeat-containing protein ITN1-like isoform X3 n=1 Tax=Corylus avellana TaxID=13451 RepID=UPI00286D688D|nr:ankyrin repeat-containing protein ITN1-like isoform X3 [Corylus avellana]
MEEGGINKPQKRRQKAKVTLARSETFPSTSNPQRASSGQAINQQESSSIPSFPTHLDQGASFIQQQPYVSNLESDSLTNRRRVANAGDASLEALGALLVKIQPSLSSLLQDLANWDAARSLPAPNFDEPQETCSLAKTSQEELEQIVSEEPIPTDWKKNSGERRLDEYREIGRPLLEAAYKGDWPTAKAFLEEHGQDFVRHPITREQGTALHNAVVAKHTTFVEELVNLMTSDDLKLQTIQGLTALHFAAQTRVVRIAKEMVKKNEELPFIHDFTGMIPLQIAAYQGDRNMVDYLFSVTSFTPLTTYQRIDLLLGTISAGFYGFKGICNKALMQTLAHQLVERLWKMVGTMPDKHLLSNYFHNHINLLFEAAEVGNIEFLSIVIRSYPDLIWQLGGDNMTLFHTAIFYRQENVFSLIYEIGIMKDNIAMIINPQNGENMLHLAGKLPPLDRLNIISGAALQMQRELLWFKEIEKIVQPSYVNKKNSFGDTPRDIFIKSHKELQENGEKWMKDTANYCMLVATLIATVVFAAAFTVPGGNNQESGIPIFLRSNWFMVFFVSDAIALFSSSTSIVIFLSILTSRYTERDFFKSLPTKLAFGLATLFISIAGMVVAFSATCFLVYNSKITWAPVVIIAAASIPVTFFFLLHYTLWADTFISTFSTFRSRFFFRPFNHRLF